MSHLLDDDDDDLQGHQNHRELTLSTGTVLGIFLGLALSWALFFGFGYHMGSKVRPDAQPTAAEAPDPASSTNFNSFKPAPGSPASSSSPAQGNSGSGPLQSIPPVSASHPDASAPSDATAIAEKPAPITLHPTQPATPPAPVSATGTFVVQVAAVSHQEDADLLVNALHGKGYSVSAHPGPDNLVHIQVGPFPNRKEAESMRQQLLSDGYNAIVK